MDFGRERHFVHAAMTGYAAYAFINVNRVVEIHEIGHVVDALPGDGLAAFEGIVNRLEFGRIRPNLRVAGHAGFGRRDIGEFAFVHRCVAIAAINAVVADVMLVGKLNRLLDGNVNLIAVRQIHAHQGHAQTGHAQHDAKNNQLGDGIRTRMKNLSHKSEENCKDQAAGKQPLRENP